MSDDVRARVAEQLLHRLRLVADGRGVRLLDEQVARVGVLEGEHHQIDRFERFMRKRVILGSVMVMGLPTDLVNEQRDHRAAGAHDIAIARTGDDCTTALRRHAGVGRR